MKTLIYKRKLLRGQEIRHGAPIRGDRHKPPPAERRCGRSGSLTGGRTRQDSLPAAKPAALHEAVTKVIGEGVTKTRRELAASAMGEALVPAAGTERCLAQRTGRGRRAGMLYPASRAIARARPMPTFESV